MSLLTKEIVCIVAPGMDLDTTIRRACVMSLKHKAPISFDFNETRVVVDINPFVYKIADKWQDERDQKQEEE